MPATTESGFSFERALIGAGSVAWLLAICGRFALLPLAGTLDLDLYRLYSFAGILGWLSGNVAVLRRRVLPRKHLLFVYLLAPVGFIYLVRACASSAAQDAAPLVPVYGFLVYLIFFLVPVTLKSGRS